MPDQPCERYAFPTTHWSLIGRAGRTADEARREALNQLLTVYWPALRTHLVKKGFPTHEADDLVQGFIENKILEHDLVARADAQRGKFRTLLATVLDRYVANELERRRAKKRTADRAVSLEVGHRELASFDAPKDSLDIEWARQTLARTLTHMEQECLATDRRDIWEVFVGRVVEPILEGASPVSYDQIVQRFVYRSPAQASNTLVTGKRMFLRALRKVVAEYALDEQDVENEIRDLVAVLSR